MHIITKTDIYAHTKKEFTIHKITISKNKLTSYIAKYTKNNFRVFNCILHF